MTVQRPGRFENWTLQQLIDYRDTCRAYCEQNEKWAKNVGLGCVLMASAAIERMASEEAA